MTTPTAASFVSNALFHIRKSATDVPVGPPLYICKMATDSSATAPTSATSSSTRQHSMLVASASGETQRVADLIAEGAEVPHDSDEPLATPCEQSALHGHLDALKLLLPHAKRQLAMSFADVEQGASAAARATHEFWCKLVSAAIRGGHQDVVAFLLSASDVDVTKSCASSESVDERENVPPLFEAVEHAQPEILELLRANGANVCAARDAQGRSLLHCAAMFGSLKCFNVVFPHCAESVDTSDRQGNTPLHYASEFGRLEIAKLLLSAGADANARNERRVTPLHLAASTGNVEMLKLLLVEGATDANLKDYNGKTPLHDVVLLDEAALEEEDPTNRALKKDSEWRQVTMAEWLLGHGADPTMVDEVTRATPLHIAVRRGLDRTTRVLLSNGADPNAVDKFGVTPLHVAAAFDASRVLWVMLLMHGADSSLVDAEGHAPLNLVADQKEREELQALVTNYQKP